MGRTWGHVTSPAVLRLGRARRRSTSAARASLFTTRRGGFSSGPYESLNLGKLTADRPEDVARNRERLQEQGRRAAGAHPPGPRHRRPTDHRAAQRHRRAADCSTGRRPRCRGVAPMVLTADCLPVAVAGDGAVAMLHAGWRGLAGGIVAEGVAARCGSSARTGGDRGGDRARRRAVLLRGRRGGPRGVRRSASSTSATGATSTCKAIARAELERAGVEVVHDVGLCTICSDPIAVVLPSPRRRRHRQAGWGRVVEPITGLRAETVRANLERVAAEIAAHGSRPGAGADAGRGQVRAARGARRARRGRA